MERRVLVKALVLAPFIPILHTNTGVTTGTRPSFIDLVLGETTVRAGLRAP